MVQYRELQRPRLAHSGHGRRQPELRAAAPESGLLHIQGFRVYGALPAAVPDGGFQPHEYTAVQFPGQRLWRLELRQGHQHIGGNRTPRSICPEIPVLEGCGAVPRAVPLTPARAPAPLSRCAEPGRRKTYGANVRIILPVRESRSTSAESVKAVSKRPSPAHTMGLSP